MIKKLVLVPLGIMIISYLASLASVTPMLLAAIPLFAYIIIGVPLAHLTRALMRRTAPARAIDPVVLTLVFLTVAVATASASVTTATLDGSVYKPIGQVNIGQTLVASVLSVIVVAAAMIIADGSAFVLSAARRKT